MIAKKHWFTIRKYGGWGLSPATKEGWFYIAAVAAPIIAINMIPGNGSLKTAFLIVWGLIFSLDFLDVFLHLYKDERETAHEALAERNAMWFMVSVLGIGIAYQVATGIAKDIYSVDPIIIVALLGSLVVKAITHLYLRNK